MVLLFINHQGSSMGYLAKTIGLDTSTMTRNIEKLEKRHFVYRERSTQDTRKILVFKSPKGIDIANQLQSEIEAFLDTPIKNKVDIQNKLNKVTWYLTKIKNINEI